VEPWQVFGGAPHPSERDCIVEAEARGMTVPLWTDKPWAHVVFARKDGTALLVEVCAFTSVPCAYVCPSVGAAVAGGEGALSAGYGVLPYASRADFLPDLLDAFMRWDGDDALATLLERAGS